MCFEGRYPERETVTRLDRLEMWASALERSSWQDLSFIAARIVERRPVLRCYRLALHAFHSDGLVWGTDGCRELQYGSFLSIEAVLAFFGLSQPELRALLCPIDALWTSLLAVNIRAFVAKRKPPNIPMLPAAREPFGLLLAHLEETRSEDAIWTEKTFGRKL